MPRVAEPIDKRFATARMILNAMARAPYRIQLRLRAIFVIYEGGSRQDAVDATGANRRTIQRWLTIWNTSGLDALIARPKRGPKRKITGQEFDKTFLPLIVGRNGKELPGWTVADVQRRLAGDGVTLPSYSTLLRAFRYNGHHPKRWVPKKSPEDLKPWPYPWPREYGTSLADYMEKSGQSLPSELGVEEDRQFVEQENGKGPQRDPIPPHPGLAMLDAVEGF